MAELMLLIMLAGPWVIVLTLALTTRNEPTADGETR